MSIGDHEVMSTSPVITATDLNRHYPSGRTSFVAVDNVSFHVERGEVRVLGLDPVTDRQALRPQLGIMLQSGGLPAALTVAETMRMWAGTCSTLRDIDEVLVNVDLTHRADVKVGALSGGEQRRPDLACALVGDPRVIFLDEPTTGLDPESRRNVWGLLEGLKERGTTMVLTTHYLEEAERLCDRIAIMHEGRAPPATTCPRRWARWGRATVSRPTPGPVNSAGSSPLST